MKYRQSIIPKAETPNEWSQLKLQQLRKIIFEYIKNRYSGMTIINIDTGLPITISVTSARKTAFGEAIYFKKAAATLLLPELIKYAEYNNWGNPKPTDGPNIIGYLNFKCKCLIDGKKRKHSSGGSIPKRRQILLQYRNQQKESPRLKGAMLNLIRSVDL